MMIIQIGVYGVETPVPSAEVLQADSGGRFIVLRMDEGLTLILNGRDETAIANARALATCLTNAADEIEHALAAPLTLTTSGGTGQGSYLMQETPIKS